MQSSIVIIQETMNLQDLCNNVYIYRFFKRTFCIIWDIRKQCQVQSTHLKPACHQSMTIVSCKIVDKFNITIHNTKTNKRRTKPRLWIEKKSSFMMTNRCWLEKYLELVLLGQGKHSSWKRQNKWDRNPAP